MKKDICFTGGPLQTNSYLVSLPKGNLLIDAPEGSAAFFQNVSIHLLILTHGHFDHIMDAAKIVRQHHCPVMMHPITEEILADKNLLRRLGLNLEIEPVKASEHLIERQGQLLLGHSFDVFEVPGHCPGSICLYDSRANILYAGDVLFAGAIGRWDLPGGNREVLLDGIEKKLLTLPPLTRLLPGHGPETTIGHEAHYNVYLKNQKV